MLGWGFYVSDADGKVAYWEDRYDDWLQDGVKENKATKVGFNGGYPDIYRVKPEILPEDKVLNKPDVDWCTVEVWDQS